MKLKVNIQLDPVQTVCILAIVLCLGIAVSIFMWAQEAEYRPLKADITLAEAIKARDILDLYDIDARASLSHHYLAVEVTQYEQAVAALTSSGFKMPPLPKYSAEVVKAMDSAAVEQDYQPILQQPWFMKLARLAAAAMVLVVLTIVVIRPALRDAVYGAQTMQRRAKTEEFLSDTEPLTEYQLKWSPRQEKALIGLITALALILFTLIIWAKQPEMRPLINDLRQVDAVNVVDVLNQHRIGHQVDADSNMLYVTYEESDRARLILGKAGLKIEYPRYEPIDIEILKLMKVQRDDPDRIVNQPWFMKIMRLLVAAVMIIVIILVLIRPLLAWLIYPEVMLPEDSSRDSKEEN